MPVAKIVANRLNQIMPILIAPTQCGFIRGRTGSNNIIIAQEIIHKMRRMKVGKGFIAIKIDLEKAYDCLEWSFVIDFLKHAGVSEHFRNIIRHCISSFSMNILWNGECTQEFFSILFVLCMERLSHLTQVVVNSSWKPITFF